MRSWIFRNRRRLETLLGRPEPVAPATAPDSKVFRTPARRTRVIELQPVRRRRSAG